MWVLLTAAGVLAVLGVGVFLAVVAVAIDYDRGKYGP